MKRLLPAIIVFAVMSCQQQPQSLVKKELFGISSQGDTAWLYTLKNDNMTVQVTNYGGAIVSIMVPDSSGETGDVVLGFDNLEDYMEDGAYFNTIIGRYANRIADGKFMLDSVEYRLEINNGPNHLHGGPNGLQTLFWEPGVIDSTGEASLQFVCSSPDGAGGYPGNIEVVATYTLTGDDELILDMKATTDKTTIINLTNHAYFNLDDGGASSIEDHLIQINAEKYTPVDSTLIPTGEIADVAGTPFDLRELKSIDAEIDAVHDQLELGMGYDHNFVLPESGDSLVFAAKVIGPDAGRVLEIYTNQPAIQFYSGNFFDGSITGKGGITYEYRSCLALEPQIYPDSPNQPDFPSPVLRPDEEYHFVTKYKFSIIK